MSKRKFGVDSDDRVSMLISSMTEAQAAVLQQLLDETPTSYKSLTPLLESIRQAYEAAAPLPKIPVKIRHAREYKSTDEAAIALGIDYKDSSKYEYRLKDSTHNYVKGLSPDFASVIEKIKSSDYVGTRHDESLSRTILDLILIDRLQHLEDKDAFYKLLLSAEVPVSINIKGQFGDPELIKGRADWVLGYGEDKMNIGSILVIVEAKPRGNASIGLPQMLVYMTAIQQARLGYINNTVFGMVSDSREFKFAFLDSNKKFYVSEPLEWRSKQQQIISYIDAMLLDAIQSSPHITPTKNQNNTYRRYRKYLEKKWAFGEAAEAEAEAEDEYEDEDDIMDVVKIGRDIVLRGVRRN